VESTVDIKDFILIGGGLLIAAVVAHGFWIGWRERRQDLRIDIKPDLIPEAVDEIVRLRGELPNGGGRVVKQPDPTQVSLDLDPPTLSLEPVDAPPLSDLRPAESENFEVTEQADQEEVDAVLFGSDWRQSADDSPGDQPSAERTDPVLGGEPVSEREPESPFVTETRTSVGQSDAAAAASLPSAESERAKVTDVAMPDPLVTEEPKRPRRLGSRKSNERGGSRRASNQAAAAAKREESRESDAATVPVEELIVMNVLSDPDRPFTGDELFATLRTCGLKFGDMNIFHRVEPLTKSVQYSVASAVEPGTFDMAEMEAIRCPGLCIFMQLPGPEDPTAAFEDMLSVAKSVVKSLGGEVRDEHRNIMTPQTVEHYRQRVQDFSRRRMSKRA
jgi:cell division protein ZipA